MNKSIEKVIIACLIVLMGFAFLAFKQSQEKLMGGNYVIVKVAETLPGAFIKSRIVVSDASGVIKTIPLESFSNRSLESNSILVAAALDELKGQGYKLVQTNSTGEQLTITNYIFEK